MARYIFLRTAWMKRYQGVTPEDIPTGAGSYVEEHHDGGEVYNFYPIRNYFYGYARIQDGRSLHIENVGAITGSAFVDNITVVLFAKNPYTGGQFVVGWYKNARLYRQVQYLQHQELGNKSYMVKAEIADSCLLPEDSRIWPVKKAGQTNAWYPERYLPPGELKLLEEYLNDPQKYIDDKRGKRRRGGGWQQDIEKRKEVEMGAMDAIAEYYELRDYEVKYCHEEKLGWDMEAVKGKQKFLLEIKGLSGEFSMVLFTPNEYKNIRGHVKNYCVCVVSNVLDSKEREIHIFRSNGIDWIDNRGRRLRIVEMNAAKLYLEDKI